jgi:putative DNA primase/helicase
MHSNYQLSIRESDDAVGRRLRHVKFDAPLRADQMDRQLKDRFKQEQRQAALAWMVDGWRMYRERGLQAPEDVMVWSRQYLDEGNNVHRFVAEQCYLAADGRVTKSDLYAEYAAWCRRNGEMPFGNKNFTQLMRQRHPQLAEQNVRPTGGYPERGWAGIGLANDRTDPNRPAETF